jgi:hypothetical protein
MTHAANENAPRPRSLLMKLFVRSWEFRYPRLLWGGRIAAGVVTLGFGFLLLAYGVWWGLLSLAAGALAFFGGYRVYQIARSRPAA